MPLDHFKFHMMTNGARIWIGGHINGHASDDPASIAMHDEAHAVIRNAERMQAALRSLLSEINHKTLAEARQALSASEGKMP